MLELLKAHKAELALVALWCVDQLFAFNPKLEANSLLHALHLAVKNLLGSK